MSPYASGYIFTDAVGVPVERPEELAPDASTTDKIVHMRAIRAYNDRVTDMANASFSKAFSKAVRG